ncbi:unannotated protein [freshwater metagenome]|uniref:Unannotated protein n=1 Tax=freshwater metagenome TaxID=449393 RepID=A0A6J6C8R1_9ZZZZ
MFASAAFTSTFNFSNTASNPGSDADRDEI